MKIQIASDLHLELYKQANLGMAALMCNPEADVLVLAGDISNGTSAIDIFRNWPVPVIYVYGNHEHYFLDMSKNTKAIRLAARNTKVHFLERDEIVIDGVRFLGCCLWTDYLVNGREHQAKAMQDCERELRDHGVIRQGGKPFMAKDALYKHVLSKNWLSEKLNSPFVGQTMVVTHHAPHPSSIHEKYIGNPVNSGFVSDLSPLMGKASAWIHGHVHDSFDYVVNGTRVIANPRGYPLSSNDYENAAFNPMLIVEV